MQAQCALWVALAAATADEDAEGLPTGRRSRAFLLDPMTDGVYTSSAPPPGSAAALLACRGCEAPPLPASDPFTALRGNRALVAALDNAASLRGQTFCEDGWTPAVLQHLAPPRPPPVDPAPLQAAAPPHRPAGLRPTQHCPLSRAGLAAAVACAAVRGLLPWRPSLPLPGHSWKPALVDPLVLPTPEASAEPPLQAGAGDSSGLGGSQDSALRRCLQGLFGGSAKDALLLPLALACLLALPARRRLRLPRTALGPVRLHGACCGTLTPPSCQTRSTTTPPTELPGSPGARSEESLPLVIGDDRLEPLVLTPRHRVSTASSNGSSCEHFSLNSEESSEASSEAEEEEDPFLRLEERANLCERFDIYSDTSAEAQEVRSDASWEAGDAREREQELRSDASWEAGDAREREQELRSDASWEAGDAREREQEGDGLHEAGW